MEESICLSGLGARRATAAQAQVSQEKASMKVLYVCVCVCVSLRIYFRLVLVSFMSDFTLISIEPKDG